MPPNIDDGSLKQLGKWRTKPEIPLFGKDGIPLRDEIELFLSN